MTIQPDELHAFRLFETYEDEELVSEVIPFLGEVTVAGGSHICRERAKGDRCFFLVDGSVAILTTLASGRVEQIGQLGPGAIFGQVVLLDGGTRSATCLASEDCRLFELFRSDYEALRNRGNRFAFDLQMEIGRSLASQIRQATENLSALSESRIQDPRALSQRLETFLRAPNRPIRNDDTPISPLRIKDFKL